MYCEECKKRPANVHLTKIVGSNKIELHLCEECAKAKGEYSSVLNPGFSLQQLLAGLLQGEVPLSQPDISTTLQEQCECGMTYRDFTTVGRLGCEKCYTTFGDRLEPLMRRIHGSSQHIGKVPLRTGGVTRLKKEIAELRNTLKSLVSEEKYEQAAEVRDRIRGLEQKLGSE